MLSIYICPAVYLTSTCLLLRELAQSSLEYATAFGQHGAIEPLVGLLDDPSKPTTLLSAQALACMVACEPCCSQIRYIRLTEHCMFDKHLPVLHTASQQRPLITQSLAMAELHVANMP